MVRALSFTVSGDRATVAAFRKLARDSDDLSSTFARIGSRVAADAARLAPKRSGALAGSIRPTGRRLGVAVVGAVPYAGVQEYGWPARGISARPYLRPAADTKADSSAEAITTEIVRLIRQAGL